MAPAREEVTSRSNSRLAGTDTVEGEVMGTLTLLPEHIFGVPVVITALGIGSTITVVLESGPAEQPASRGDTV